MKHATSGDFATYSGSSAPADIERLLQRASKLVDSFVLSPYSVEANGSPTETYVAEALRDATCAQIEWWLETGDEVEATARFEDAGVGGLRLGTTGLRIAPRALDELNTAGLRQVMA